MALGVQPLPATRAHLARIPGLWSLLVRLDRRRRTPARIEAGLRAELTPTELAALDPAALQRFCADAATWSSGTGLRNDVRSMSTAADRSPGVTGPTVIVHGDADTVVPLACAEHHARTIPGARLHVLPGIGHGVPLTARARVGDLTRGLLSRAAR